MGAEFRVLASVGRKPTKTIRTKKTSLAEKYKKQAGYTVASSWLFAFFQARPICKSLKWQILRVGKLRARPARVAAAPQYGSKLTVTPSTLDLFYLKQFHNSFQSRSSLKRCIRSRGGNEFCLIPAGPAARSAS